MSLSLLPPSQLYILTFRLHSRAYAARMSFYRLKQFQCEVTGKSGLDYFQAVESERQEARTMHARFSEPLKYPVLRAVQWRKSNVANCPSHTRLNTVYKRSWVALTISSKPSMNVLKIAISSTKVRHITLIHNTTLTPTTGVLVDIEGVK